MAHAKGIDIRQSGDRVRPWDFRDENWAEGGSYSYGHMDMAKDGEWVLPHYTGGSDYSGSLVERSNYDVLLEAAEEWTDKHPGKAAFYVTLHGGHGTFAIAFHVERTPGPIREIIAGLDNYPLADEDHHSHVEMEAQSEAWDNWAARDYRKALEKRWEGSADVVTDSDLFRHFCDAADKANVYWENQSGPDMYIDVERVAEAAEDVPPGWLSESEVEWADARGAEDSAAALADEWGRTPSLDRWAPDYRIHTEVEG